MSKLRRKNGVFSRLGNWLKGEPMPTLAQVTSQTGKRRITDLPASADGVRLEGDRYINGRCCKTVGDVKEADRRDPTMGGWSG